MAQNYQFICKIESAACYCVFFTEKVLSKCAQWGDKCKVFLAKRQEVGEKEIASRLSILKIACFFREILEKRVSSRPGHFMPAGLLASQLATLELPGPSEHNIFVVNADTDNVEDVISLICNDL